MLNIIRKRLKSSEAAAAEFEAANRQDLKDREVAQIAVLDGYVQDSNSMGEKAISAAIQDVVDKMRTEEKEVNRGSIMKALVGPGGSLEGRMVDKSDVAKLVGNVI